MRAILLCAAALALVLPGCIDVGPAATSPIGEEGLSQVLFDNVLAEALPVTADDGVLLDMWIYRPDGATGVPIIINFSPYWSNLAPPTAEGGDAYSLYLIEHFVARGYAVALVSARGTGLSEGCFTIGGAREVDDMVQVLDALAEQPWTNGNFAAVGKSYDGTMAQGLLTRNHPNLKTIVPTSPISEFYKYNYYGGVPYDFGGLLFNTYYVAEVSAAQSQDPSSPTWAVTPTRFCEESVDVQVSQYQSAATGDYTAYWQERNYTALLPDTIDASVFYVHGLADWNVKPDHMTPWIDELQARGVTVKMELGQWPHEYSNRDDQNATLLRWLDSELKGIDTGIKAEPLVHVQDLSGMWRTEDRWPPARATPMVLYPADGGALAAEPGSGSGMYTDSPYMQLPIAPAAMDLLYESEPMDRAVRIVGSPILTATVSSTGPRATLSVALLVDGEIVDQGFLDLAHRNGLETSEPMTPGESYQVTVPLFPQDIVVPAGSTIGLVLSSSAPEGANVVVRPVSFGGAVTLTHGEGTALTIPIIEGDDVVLEDPQPEDTECWTC